jgi:hypothetical protein
VISIDMTGFDRTHHFRTGSKCTVVFEDAFGGSVGLTFTGAESTKATDIAIVFDAYRKPEVSKLLEAAMIALDHTTNAALELLICAARDMQSHLSEMAAQ